jgi:hypothetical protein
VDEAGYDYGESWIVAAYVLSGPWRSWSASSSSAQPPVA